MFRIAYIVKSALALDLPRRMQVSFYKVIQAKSETTGREMTSKDITGSFRHAYHLGGGVYDGRLVLKSFVTTDIRSTPSNSATPDLSPQSDMRGSIASLSIADGQEVDRANDRNLQSIPKRLTAKVSVDGKVREISGEGNGPLSSFLDALQADFGIALSIREYTEHGVGAGSDVKAATYVELIPPEADPKDKTRGGFWGVGVDADITASGLKAVVSAANGYLDAEDVDVKDED